MNPVTNLRIQPLGPALRRNQDHATADCHTGGVMHQATILDTDNLQIPIENQ